MSDSRVPIDKDARDEALNSLGSYCVTAPAGSGKTALLVKRYLTLLGRCDEPEQVVAITFTRKAAAEMRSRVLEALNRVQSESTASNDHERQLENLAAKVLEVDRERNWQLQSIPNRFSIRTIDSFCAELSRQMPVLSGIGGPLAVTDDAGALYRQAVENLIDNHLHATKGLGADLQRLLLHLDNRWDLTVNLLSNLLGRREQWLPMFGSVGFSGEERQQLQNVAAELVRERLAQLRQGLGVFLHPISDLMAYREANIPGGSPFDADSDLLGGWRQLVDVLLTQTGTWRKSVNKRDGFPAGKGEAAEKRDAMIAILDELRDGDEGLLSSLAQVRVLPDPEGDGRHWEVLASVTRLLPVLSAELLLVFERHGQVDHSQIALAAIDALGNDEEPTDLALRLDYRIDHLLVDEFQDTSSLQFELVRRLTRGWREFNAANPQAPRTLLLVGDAMQSIYGFRQANVGLFIRARDQGVGELSLTPLELNVNFRSTSGLVDWTNRHFEGMFPTQDDAQVGAVSFRQARSMRRSTLGADVRLFTGDGAQTGELDALCAKLELSLADDSVKSMVILGRTRTHLRPILAALRARGIPFAGQDLDALSQRPIIRDLMTLCGVLADPFDRLPWLSLLRCPVAALDHQDLLQVALHEPIPALFVDADLRELTVSAVALERLAHLQRVLWWARQYRHRLALRVWVEECWRRVGGADTCKDAGDASDVERFFQLLESMEQNREPMTQETLDKHLEQLYASPQNADAKLQIMTLHKAKGLEFDAVFIPFLGRGTASQDHELLLWEEVDLPAYGSSFLMDIRAGSEKPVAPQLYDFLHDHGRNKRRLENDRLFYVGCTRAADYLWLSGCLTWDEAKDSVRAPQSSTLLARIWPQLDGAIDVEHCPAGEEGIGSTTLPYKRLRTVPAVPAIDTALAANREVPPDSRLARALGTAVHRCLESLAYGTALPDCMDAELGRLLRFSLLEAGADEVSLDELMTRGQRAIDAVLEDDWARWMLSPKRRERFPELAMTLVDAGEVRNLILDYTFVDELTGERWVVDYKTASPEVGEAPESFVAAQSAKYAEQLGTYRKALEGRFEEPVRCALYFTALGTMCELPP